MATAKLIELLKARFPGVDDENLEETLEACDGDVEQAAEVLTDVLLDEGADRAMPVLATVIEGATRLAQIAPDQQPAEERVRLLRVCEALDARGVRLLKPVLLLLDGEREEEALLSGLDEADAVVVRQILGVLVLDDDVDQPPALAAEATAVDPAKLGEAELARLVADFEEVLLLVVQLERAPRHREVFVATMLGPLQAEAGIGLLPIVQRLWDGERDVSAPRA